MAISGPLPCEGVQPLWFGHIFWSLKSTLESLRGYIIQGPFGFEAFEPRNIIHLHSKPHFWELAWNFFSLSNTKTSYLVSLAKKCLTFTAPNPVWSPSWTPPIAFNGPWGHSLRSCAHSKGHKRCGKPQRSWKNGLRTRFEKHCRLKSHGTCCSFFFANRFYWGTLFWLYMWWCDMCFILQYAVYKSIGPAIRLPMSWDLAMLTKHMVG